MSDVHSTGALRQQPEAAVPGQWYAFDTAPKSGGMFVVQGFNVTCELTGARNYTTDPRCVFVSSDGELARWPHYFLPTHWTPLPPPPEQAASGSDQEARSNEQKEST